MRDGGWERSLASCLTIFGGRRFDGSSWRYGLPTTRGTLMPHGFGVGWTVNVGRLVELARRGNEVDV